MVSKKKQAFLSAFEACGSVTAAARAARITRACHYLWLQTDAQYALVFGQSKMIAGDVLEDEAVRRAVEGWEEPVYYQGNKVGSVTRYSDGMLQFLLRGFKPEKYGTQRIQIPAPGVAAVESRVEVVFVTPDPPDPPAEEYITSVRPVEAIAAPHLPTGHEHSRRVVPPVPLPSKWVWTQ
jgi:hypothetical protein